jgi:putative membrane protein
MYLSRSEVDAVEARTRSLEVRTGVEVSTAVVGRCDAYAEIPWKAFALGAALAALAVVVADAWQPEWDTGIAARWHALAILGAGAALALLAVFVRPCARVLLDAHLAHARLRRYAEAMFLRRGLDNTSSRRAILLLVAVFERRVEIVADRGLDGLGEPQWNSVIAHMAADLAAGHYARALLSGLDRLEAVLLAHGQQGSWEDRDDVPDRPIQARGPQ